MTDQVIDAEVVPDEEPGVPVQPVTGSQLVRRERRSEVIRPLDTEELALSFKAYQDLLPKLLTGTDWQDAGRGQRFVKKSGWRKIATAFDLDVFLISDEVERDDAGTPLRARVIARAVAPSGRSMDGDGYCSVDEPRFEKASARQKLENDLRGTATTRAKNRAIADLVGMGAVSAEETDESFANSGSPFGMPASESAGKAARQACGQLLRGDVDRAVALYKQVVEDCGGVLTMSAASALSRAASAVDPTTVEAPEVN